MRGRAIVLGGVFVSACAVAAVLRSRSQAAPPFPPTRLPEPVVVAADAELDACRALAERIQESPALPGAPGFEAMRLEILGRARGEPMVFARAPEAKDFFC